MTVGVWSLCARAKYIGGRESPLLIRWTLFSCPWFGVMLHKFCRSDHERALHDHPWPFVSIILRGGYVERTDDRVMTHRPGAILFRPATWRHCVVLRPGTTSWSLVLKGARVRRWGFWPNGTWCWWRTYNADLAICGDDLLHTGGED